MGTSEAASTANGNRNGNGQEVKVGTYYYPWHGDNFHNGDGYVRRDLDPPQLPTLGEYDDTKPEVIAQHLRWSRQANIGLWVTSWWGPGGREDRTTREVIMEHEDVGDLKIALHYESTGRVRPDEGYDTERVAPDMEYICDTYFQHDNYYRIDGRPVMFMYISRHLNGMDKLEEVALIMRTVANKCGESLYLVGDHVFGDAPSDGSDDGSYDGSYDVSFLYFDAVTNYDVYGSMGAGGLHAGADAMDGYYNEQALWRRRAGNHGCGFVAAAAPGYNDRGVRLDANHLALSRSLTEDDVEGSLFEHALRRARDLVDTSSDSLLMINSFNEWHEDTQIEPVAVSPSVTSVPASYRNGVEYGGYDDLYFRLLHDVTVGYEAPYYSSSDRLSDYS